MSASPQKPIAELAKEFGLKPDEYAVILQRLNREPNMVELGVFSVMWSEHCSYKSSRRHLGKFPTKGPRVICGPGENAGVIDIGDGQACIFKMESHNHPSYIEPYQGAATGVGGIMRDVFTMGARPIALLNALRFGDPEPSQDPAAGRGRGGRHRRLRQLRGRAHRGGRDQLPPRLQRQHPGQRHVRGPGRRRQDLLLGRPRGGPAGGLFRLQDRPRRHPRRDHGLGRVRRGLATRSAPRCRSATPSPRSC